MGLVTINFTAARYHKLLVNEITTDDFINETLQQRVAAICELLKYNHLDDGGSPEIDEFKIAELTYNPATQTGSVQLSYDIRFFWGCSGIKKTQASKERCAFIIHPEKLTLSLTVPEKLVRDMHEEL